MHSMLRVWEIYALENAVFEHCSLWAAQTINFLYTQHRMLKHAHLKLVIKNPSVVYLSA